MNIVITLFRSHFSVNVDFIHQLDSKKSPYGKEIYILMKI